MLRAPPRRQSAGLVDDQAAQNAPCHDGGIFNNPKYGLPEAKECIASLKRITGRSFRVEQIGHGWAPAHHVYQIQRTDKSPRDYARHEPTSFEKTALIGALLILGLSTR